MTAHLGVPLLILLRSVGTTILFDMVITPQTHRVQKGQVAQNVGHALGHNVVHGGNQYPVRGCGAVISQP